MSSNMQGNLAAIERGDSARAHLPNNTDACMDGKVPPLVWMHHMACSNRKGKRNIKVVCCCFQCFRRRIQ